MTEQPWPPGDRDAMLQWEGWNIATWTGEGPPPDFTGVGVLWFISPETEGWHASSRCVIHVSKTVPDAGTEIGKTNIWKIEDNGDGTVTVRPSVHFIGHFHSGNPVRFRLVEKLWEETRTQ